MPDPGFRVRMLASFVTLPLSRFPVAGSCRAAGNLLLGACRSVLFEEKQWGQGNIYHNAAPGQPKSMTGNRFQRLFSLRFEVDVQ